MIYVEFSDIEGPVTDANHQGWVEAEHLDFIGVSQSVNSTVGHEGDRINSRPGFGEFILTKRGDKSSVKLMNKAQLGKPIDTVTIHFVSSGTDAHVHTKYKLTDVLISHMSERATRDDSFPLEQLRLNYKTIEKTYSDSTGTPSSCGYDLPKATGK